MTIPLIDRTRIAVVASMFVPVVFIATIGITAGLGQYARRLRIESAATLTEVSTLQRTLDRSIQISSIEGRPLPQSLVERLAPLSGETRSSQAQLVIAYTSDVCTSCLQSGLTSIKRLIVRDTLLTVHALIGERSARTREAALLLKEERLLPNRIAFVPAEEIERTLYQHLKGAHAEEPIYLVLDENFEVRSAFQADQRRPQLLDQWLASVLP